MYRYTHGIPAPCFADGPANKPPYFEDLADHHGNDDHGTFGASIAPNHQRSPSRLSGPGRSSRVFPVETLWLR